MDTPEGFGGGPSQPRLFTFADKQARYPTIRNKPDILPSATYRDRFSTPGMVIFRASSVVPLPETNQIITNRWTTMDWIEKFKLEDEENSKHKDEQIRTR